MPEWLGRIMPVLTDAIVGYFVVLILLRLGGKRTLTQMSAFDIVVAITMGAVLGKTILDSHIPILHGLLVIALLVVMQALVAWLSAGNRVAQFIVTRRPVLLMQDGRVDVDALEQARISEAELLRTLREHGIGQLEQVGAVVLEADGKLSVLRAGSGGETLRDVK
jgi:uncharacterized membrane protein YcaP (DUF421 family)